MNIDEMEAACAAVEDRIRNVDQARIDGDLDQQRLESTAAQQIIGTILAAGFMKQALALIEKLEHAIKPLTPSTSPAVTFSISMQDVMNAWTGRYVQTNEDGDGYFADRPATIEEAVLVTAANILAGRFHDAVKRDVSKATVEMVYEHANGQIASWVSARLAEPIQLTDSYGAPKGQPTTFAELAQKALDDLLTERVLNADGKRVGTGGSIHDRDRERFTMPELIVAREVKGKLLGELTEAIDAAKAAAVQAVEDEATSVVSKVIADRLAGLKEAGKR